MQELDFTLERCLHMSVASRTSNITLKVGGLRKIKAACDMAECWACNWSMTDIYPETQVIYGEDALHALTNCLAFLRGLIRDQAETGCMIWWITEGDEAGFDALA